jgi:hypothetical protein
MSREDWRCPFCDAEWFCLALIQGQLMQCFRCWRTWLPRTVETYVPTD